MHLLPDPAPNNDEDHNNHDQTSNLTVKSTNSSSTSTIATASNSSRSDSFAEAYDKFSKFLEETQNKLDKSCCCSLIQHQQATSSTPDKELRTNNSNGTCNLTPNNSSQISTNSALSIANASSCHLSPIATTTKTHHLLVNDVDKTNISNDFKPSLPNSSNKKSTSLHNKTWTDVILYHQEIQNEIETVGLVHSNDVRENSVDLSDQARVESVNLRSRYEKLWLLSLEALVRVESHSSCPIHSFKNSSLKKPLPRTVPKARISRRPVSFPNSSYNGLEWDYTSSMALVGIQKSSEKPYDFDLVDEQTTRSLTEFGENYDLWLDNEISKDTYHERPPFVEVAQAKVIDKRIEESKSSLSKPLTLTKPSDTISIDGSRYQDHTWNFKDDESSWRHVRYYLLIFIIVSVVSVLYYEPPHLHKYYYISPPI